MQYNTMVRNNNIILRNMVDIMSQQNLLLDRSNLINFLSNMNKHFINYGWQDNHGQKHEYTIKLLKFLKKAMQNSAIKLQEKHLNPLRLIIDLLKKIYSQNIGCSLQETILVETQKIIQIMYKKITNNIQNDRVIAQIGKNSKIQIQVFKQLFKGIRSIFQLNLYKNLQIISYMNLQVLNQSSHIIWFYLMSQVLVQQQPCDKKTQVIMKFLNYAYINRNIGSLHFIQTILIDIINSIIYQQPSSILWLKIQKRMNIKFEMFLHKVVDYILSLFSICDQNLILMGQQVLKQIFWKLGLKQYKYMSQFYRIYQNIAMNIEQTIMGRNDYLALRMNYFNSLSSIWCNQGKLSHMYRIFGIISQRLIKNPSVLSFSKYLIDLTGVLGPIQDSNSFKIIGQLIYNHIQVILPQYIGSVQKRNIVFNQTSFLKIFLKFIYQLINDQFYRLRYSVHSQLCIKYQQLLKPYLISILSYNYPNELFEVWIKFLQLNPLSQPLPLHFTMKSKNSMYYKSLIRQYFENIHRFNCNDQIMQIYNYIGTSTQYMYDWWQQIINRDLKPKINLIDIVQSKPWSTSRQKQRFAKMLYQISKYDHHYWKIQGNPTQNQYIQWFIISISNIKQQQQQLVQEQH